MKASAVLIVALHILFTPACTRATVKDAIAVQGIEYPATLQDNLCLNNHLCRPKEATAAADLVRGYMDKCPDASVLIGGYSQGAAMLSRIIDRLEQEYRDRIAGAVTFGSTMQVYDKGTIPLLPPDKVRMFCNKYDPVCSTGIPLGAVMSAHRNYRPLAKEAAEFLVKMLAAAKGWSSVPTVPDVDLTPFANTQLVFRDIYRGAPAGSSTPFNDATKLQGLQDIKIDTIFGRGGARVDFLGVKVDGMDGTQEHGGSGGDYKEIVLDVDEYWIEAELCNGRKKKKDRIGYFSATTTTGEIMSLGEKTNDRCITFKPAEGNSFVGLYGESGAEIDSLGLIEFPITI
ncbi:cutinase-2 [Colletotrichum camelliae]|nr:cutinase-2 [Colletotrichum camelliae]